MLPSMMPATWPAVALVLSSIAIGEPIVRLQETNVTYRGVTNDDVEHFLNIRYAADTSGTRRFAPPELYAPKEGSDIAATAPGPACPQFKAALPPFFDETSEISEDCLNLRISRPVGTTADDKLPVIVWLHGGGVVKGSAYDSHFEPDNLLTLSMDLGKPVIYVAMQYRITIFGFARLPILKEQKSMNVGMRDQRAGFQWIKNNIAAFGGDPDCITASGVSSGATFSALQTLAYGGEEGVPFHRIWAMSGPPGNAFNATSDATEMHTRAVARMLQCDKDDDEKTLECLRDVPMKKLTDVAMEYSVANHPPYGIHTFIPSIDGDFMPDRHSVLYKSGRFVKVFGWDHDDGSGSAVPPSSYQGEEDMKVAFKPFAHALTDEDFKSLFLLYPASDFEEELHNYELNKKVSEPIVSINFFRLSRMLRDLLFSCSSLGFGYEMWRQSKSLDPTFPGVRIYDLNQSMLTPMMKSLGMPYLGVCHGSDTHYILNGVFPEGEISEADRKLSRSMAGSFIQFAYTGDPTFANDEHFSSWPESFSEFGSPDEPLPSSISVHLVGGPFGSGSGSSRVSSENILAGIAQDVLGGDPEYGEMGSMKSQIRQRIVEREKLLERCRFIDTLHEKLGI
ncbi:hypothetical protein CHU98_g8986 [Xylaria longipes]|nr:hypothetical protein CHU98_g8986 [Xylaria longipes]